MELARQRESFLTQLADAASDLEALHEESEHRLILERQEVANEVETASAEMLASMVEEHTRYNEEVQRECDEKVRQAQAKLSMKVGAFITGGSEYEELLAENNRLKDPLMAQELQQQLQIENETLQLRIAELTDALNSALSTVEFEQAQRTQLMEEHHDKVTRYEAEVERLIHLREEKEEEVEMFRSETQRLNQALTALTEQMDSLRREGENRSGVGNRKEGNNDNGSGDSSSNSSGVGGSSSGSGGSRTGVGVGILGGVKSCIITGGGNQRKHSDAPIANTTPINDTTTPITSTTTTNANVTIENSPGPSPGVPAFSPSESSRRRVSDHSHAASPSPSAPAPSSSDNNTIPSATPFTPSIAHVHTTPVRTTPSDSDNATDSPSSTPQHVVITTPTSNDFASSDSTPVGNSGSSGSGGGGSAVSGSVGGGSGKGGSSSKSRVQELIAKMNRGNLANSKNSNNNNNSGIVDSNIDASQEQGL